MTAIVRFEGTKGFVMAVQYLAAHRFGLGRRFDDPAIGDPKDWLVRQIGDYDPAPAAIAGLAGREAIATAYAEYRDERQAMRREAKNAEMRDDDGAEVQTMRRMARAGFRRHYGEAARARLTAAVATRTPFPERLVHFWSNHFAISADKQTVVGFAGNYENDAIRPHVMGKFSDLLSAAVHHPAMLLFLDQAQSFGPDSPFAARVRNRGKRQAPGLNENLAREIMELHTLGVRAGYTQADVTNFAKALTGLTVAGLGRGAGQRLVPVDARPGETIFVDRLHQPGPLTILGKRYDQPGAKQAEAVLRDLAVHPATARYVATKLARHFAGNPPPPALVDALAERFLDTDGDLPSIYRTLVERPEPWAAPPMFRSPWDWLVGAARAIDYRSPNPRLGYRLTVELGQPVWEPKSPAGYADTSATWTGSDALMRRIEAAERIAASAREADPRALAPRLFPDTVSEATLQAIARAESQQQGLALLFASPEMMRR